MSQRHPRDLAALKTGFRLLVDRVGGFEAASAALGYRPSHLSEAASLHHPQKAPRVDHVAELEALAGEPFVTTTLARLSGHVLLPIPSAKGETAAALAEVLRGAGELGGRTALALADGQVDEAERAALLDQLALLGRVVAQAQAVLAGGRPQLRAVPAA